MNILYLGSLTSYVTQNDVGVFRSMGHKVTILNTSPVRPGAIRELTELNDVVSLRNEGYLGYLNAGLQGTLASLALTALRQGAGILRKIVQDRQIDMIYAQWGSNLIPVVKTVQEARLRAPIVYNFLSYPQNVYKWKVTFENWYCRKPIEKLDGRIHATVSMFRYMDRRFNLKKHGIDTIITPFFSKRYLYRARIPLLSENDGEPHLVFIGSLSLPWDDIRQEICRITGEKIHLHIAQTNVPIPRSSYLHLFPYFPAEQLADGSLATFMTQFDACIVLFNFKVCSCMDRFYTSLPSRFLSALNAGIPVVMPKGYLLACEEFVKRHQIGSAYENLTELKGMLSDDSLMHKYRANAMEKRDSFTYEENLRELNKLIGSVTS